LLSTSLFSASYYNSDKNTSENYQEKTNFEAGALFGYITSSGLFLKYNIDNELSIRVNGYIVKWDNDLIYNAKLALLKTVHNSKYGEFYLIGSAGLFEYDNNYDYEYEYNDNETIYFLGIGLGYKYKIERGVDIFFELEQNFLFLKNDSDDFITTPIPTVGISVDF
jgi:hypothetical protein